MKTIYCSYSDLNYRDNQILISGIILEGRMFDQVVLYTREWIETQSFYLENLDILNRERLAGYALWKPYIILDALLKADEGDIIVYMDCGDLPQDPRVNDHVKTYMEENDQYFLTTGVQYANKKYTKRDCFILMDCDKPEYWDSIQLENGFISFKKIDRNIELVKEWLHFCKDKRIVTDEENTCGLPNFDGFIDHRHDQSILSLLQQKYKLPTSSGIRQFVECNKLYHKRGSSFSNGCSVWDSYGNRKK